jgi:hypothetical protein
MIRAILFWSAALFLSAATAFAAATGLLLTQSHLPI